MKSRRPGCNCYASEIPEQKIICDVIFTRKVFFAKVYLTFNFHKRKIESENNIICRLGDLDGRNERINS